MDSENSAYLFDSQILERNHKETIYEVVSFAGNPLSIAEYAKDAVEKFELSTHEVVDFVKWLKIPKNNDAIIPFLMKLYEDVENIGMLSFFMEKNYAAFIYLLGLMVNPFKVDEPDVGVFIEELYSAYQSKYNDNIEKDSIVDTVTVFNERIHHLIKTQRFSFFKTLLKEHGRDVVDQIDVLEHMGGDEKYIYKKGTDFFYLNRLLVSYQDEKVHQVYATPDAAKHLSNVRDSNLQSSELIISTGFNNGNYDTVAEFARIIMMFFHYFIEKVVATKDVDSFPEEEKSLFIIVWMILQKGNSTVFIDNRSYAVIKDILSSLKKDITD